MNVALSSLQTLAIIAMIHQMIVICGMVALGIALYSFIRSFSEYIRAKAELTRMEAARVKRSAFTSHLD